MGALKRLRPMAARSPGGHDGHAIQREGCGALCRRKRVYENGLLHRRQSSAAHALQHPEEDKAPRLGAKPHSSELIVKIATQIM
jgi:hypothetical protein